MPIDFVIFESSEKLFLPEGEYVKNGIPFQPMPGARIAWIEFYRKKGSRPFKVLLYSKKNSKHFRLYPKTKSIRVGKRGYHLFSIKPIHHEDEEFFSVVAKEDAPQGGKIPVL